jgi:hypothetical protein
LETRDDNTPAKATKLNTHSGGGKPQPLWPHGPACQAPQALQERRRHALLLEVLASVGANGEDYLSLATIPPFASQLRVYFGTLDVGRKQEGEMATHFAECVRVCEQRGAPMGRHRHTLFTVPNTQTHKATSPRLSEGSVS